jgi:acetylornithine deacetylase/succinyl-diaminopimelate desuccinylase-like protein
MPLAANDSVADLARVPTVRSALEWFRKERAWINDQHLKVCRVAAPTFLEEKRAAYMQERFRDLGWEAWTDRAGNVAAGLPGRRLRTGDASIAITAHMDTVLAPRVPEDISISAQDGSFLGPGVGDNGAGLAALLALAGVWNEFPDLFADASLAPMLVANVGEEGEGNLSGMRFLCRAHAARPKAFLILDGPATEHITCRALGSRRFEIVVTGPGGHSWSDHGTGNAVHAISRVIANFTDAVPREQSPRSSFNFGLIQGGTSINSIPVEARAKVDLRSEDPSMMDRMAVQLQSAVDRALDAENAGTNSRVNAKVKEIGFRPGGELAPDAPILDSIRAVDQFLGIRSQLDCSSTDANIPLSLGIPAISIGTGGSGGGAHTPGEWFHPEGRELGLRRILLMTGLLLSRPTPVL